MLRLASRDKDIFDIAELYKLMLSELYPSETLKDDSEIALRVEKWFSNNNDVFVFTIDHKTVAFCVASVDNTLLIRQKVYNVHNLYILKDYRKTSIFTIFLNTVKKKSNNSNAKAMWTATSIEMSNISKKIATNVFSTFVADWR